MENTCIRNERTIKKKEKLKSIHSFLRKKEKERGNVLDDKIYDKNNNKIVVKIG